MTNTIEPLTGRPSPIVVGIVDDHPAIVASIAAAITASDDMEVGGVATTLGEAQTMLTPSGRTLDVVLCDMQLSGGAEGLQLLATIGSSPGRPAVIILTAFDQRSLIRAAFERGAAGYVVKAAAIDDILAAVRTVAAGGTAFSATAVNVVRSAPRRPSDREIQVIELVGTGASNAEAAAILGLSEKTIESHLRRLFDRYGVLSRTELAVVAIDEGWIRTVRATP